MQFWITKEKAENNTMKTLRGKNIAQCNIKTCINQKQKKNACNPLTITHYENEVSTLLQQHTGEKKQQMKLLTNALLIAPQKTRYCKISIINLTKNTRSSLLIHYY